MVSFIQKWNKDPFVMFDFIDLHFQYFILLYKVSKHPLHIPFIAEFIAFYQVECPCNHISAFADFDIMLRLFDHLFYFLFQLFSNCKGTSLGLLVKAIDRVDVEQASVVDEGFPSRVLLREFAS
jgi:hypothetical protein